jgi:hypothetical protein
LSYAAHRVITEVPQPIGESRECCGPIGQKTPVER